MQTTKAAAHEIAVFYTTNGQLATRALYQVAEELAARSGVLTLAEALAAEVRVASCAPTHAARVDEHQSASTLSPVIGTGSGK